MRGRTPQRAFTDRVPKKENAKIEAKTKTA